LELTYHIEELEAVAKTVLARLHSRTILFEGAMGVGKTTLIKSFVKALGSDDDVTSPTFSLVNEYKAPEFRMYHFDMYRITDEIEALNFGFEDYLNSDSDWVFIEWPGNVSSLLPENRNTITITEKDKTSRTLKLS